MSKRIQRDPPAPKDNDNISAFLADIGVENIQLDSLPDVKTLTGMTSLNPFQMMGPNGKPIDAKFGKFSRVDTSSTSANMDAEEMIRKGFQEVTDTKVHMRGLTGGDRGRIFVRPPALEEAARQMDYERFAAKLEGSHKSEQQQSVQSAGGGGAVSGKRTTTTTTTGGWKG